MTDLVNAINSLSDQEWLAIIVLLLLIGKR